MEAAASGGPTVTYQSLIDDYLSEAHRNHPGTGCPVSALAGDIARSDKRTRAVVTRQIRDNIALVATLIRDTNQNDQGEKDKEMTEDERDKGKEEIQSLLKKFEDRVGDMAEKKSKEVMEQ